MLLAVSGGPAQRPSLDGSDPKNANLTARDVSAPFLLINTFGHFETTDIVLLSLRGPE